MSNVENVRVISKKSHRLIKEFDTAVREHAFRGSAHPEDRASIEGNLEAAEVALAAHIIQMEEQLEVARKEAAAAKKVISETHKNAVTHTDCEITNCPICDGGLFRCADCGAAEIEAEQRICTAYNDPGKLKPLDLANLLRDAFFSGRGISEGSQLSKEDIAAWTEYNPPWKPYRRVTHKLGIGALDLPVDPENIRDVIVAMGPHVITIKAAGSINREWGRVVHGQVEAAEQLMEHYKQLRIIADIR